MLGWAALTLIGAGGCVALAVVAARHGVLAALLAGFGLRLLVMLMAHRASLDLGDHGSLFIDDQRYLGDGNKLAHVWAHGSFPNPDSSQAVGTLQFGYQFLLGATFLLGNGSILLGKLLNVLIGAAIVIVTARMAGDLFGRDVERRTAWLVALAPGLIWWSAPLLKEAACALLVMVALWSAVRLPEPRFVAAFVASIPVLLVFRSSAAAAVLITVVATGLLAHRRRTGRLVDTRVVLVVGGGVAVLVAAAVVSAGGSLSTFVHQYHSALSDMVDQYQGGNALHIPVDMVKTMVTPFPWAFDQATRNWSRAEYPGVWGLYVLYPLAARGAWRLRRSSEGWGLVGFVVLSLLLICATTGFAFRQRSTIEPVLLVLAAVGYTSVRDAIRVGAATLLVAAAAAAADHASPVTCVLVVVAGLAGLAAARWTPDRPPAALLPASRLDARPETPG